MDLIKEADLIPSWSEFFQSQSRILSAISSRLKHEERDYNILPMSGKRLSAFALTPPQKVKVIILAQDPYPTPAPPGGEPNAMGLAFSVPKGNKIPASLKNIYNEVCQNDSTPLQHGDLSSWASQGVFLLNTTLTLREKQSNSHKYIGWDEFTFNAIDYIVKLGHPCFFLSFGLDSHKLASNFARPNVYIMKTSHPSPLSYYRGAKNGTFPAFKGSNCFQLCNDWLSSQGVKPIDWFIS